MPADNRHSVKWIPSWVARMVERLKPGQRLIVNPPPTGRRRFTDDELDELLRQANPDPQ